LYLGVFDKNSLHYRLAIYIMQSHNRSFKRRIHRETYRGTNRLQLRGRTRGFPPCALCLFYKGATISPAKSNSYGRGHPRLRPLTRGPVPLICLTKILRAVH